MPMMTLGEWLPDQNPIALPGLLQADNVYPTATGYRSFLGRNTVPGLSALLYPARGALSGDTQAGVKFTIVGTRESGSGVGREMKILWETGDWKDILPIGGEFTSLADEQRISFATYGDTIFAVGREAKPCFVDTDTNSPSPTNRMAAISSNAPFGDVCAVFKEFLIIGNIEGRGTNIGIGVQRGGLQWSAIGNPKSWPMVATAAAINVQSDFQVLDGDGGEITAIVPAGEWCAVFRQNQVWRMDYVGGNQFFSFRKIDANRGCVIQGGAISVGGVVYFPSSEGFLACDGSRVTPVGEEKVDRYWRETSDPKSDHNVSAVYNAETESIYWTMTTGSNTPNTILGYRPNLQRWFQLTNQTSQVLFDSVSAVVGGNLDALPYSAYLLDSTGSASDNPSDWAVSTDYNVGDVVRGIEAASVENAYRCSTAGTSNGSGTGPTGTSTTVPVADGTVAEWLFADDLGPAGATTQSVILQDVDLDGLGIRVGYNALATVDDSGDVGIYNDEVDTLASEITTGDFEAPGGGRAVLRWVRPVYSGDSNFSGSAAGRLTPNGTVTMKPLLWMEEAGVLSSGPRDDQDRRVGGRYIRAQFVSAKPMEKFSGFDFEVRSSVAPSRTTR
jgi:hypothetical protein